MSPESRDLPYPTSTGARFSSAVENSHPKSSIEGEFGHGLLLYLHKVAGVGVLELSAGPTVGWKRRELIVLADAIANDQSAHSALQCNYNVCPIAPVVTRALVTSHFRDVMSPP